MDPILLTLPDAQAASGLSRRGLEYLINDRKIESRKIGRRRLIVAASLRKFLAADRPGRISPAPPAVAQ